MLIGLDMGSLFLELLTVTKGLGPLGLLASGQPEAAPKERWLLPSGQGWNESTCGRIVSRRRAVQPDT